MWPRLSGLACPFSADCSAAFDDSAFLERLHCSLDGARVHGSAVTELGAGRASSDSQEPVERRLSAAV